MYLAARSKEKADAAISELKVATGKEALFLELDLASLASVKEAVEDFLRFDFLMGTAQCAPCEPDFNRPLLQQGA